MGILERIGYNAHDARLLNERPARIYDYDDMNKAVLIKHYEFTPND